MALGRPAKKSAPLLVWQIAAALVVAAFLGAALGLVWQSSGLGEDEEAASPVTAETPDA